MAAALETGAAVDGFGAVVDSHTRGILAAGVSRLCSKFSARRVALAATDIGLCRFAQPELLVVLGSHGSVQLMRNPASSPPRVQVRRPLRS